MPLTAAVEVDPRFYVDGAAPPDAPVGAPLYPPERFFAPPADMGHGDKLTVITAGPDLGRVYGYVAAWDSCLLNGDERRECLRPPRSPSNYVAAMGGDTVLDDGRRIATANLGGGINHAGDGPLSMAVDHYANAQPLWAKVLTPTGWRTMSDLAPGDSLIDPQGARSEVLGVYPQGVKEVWRVTLADGSCSFATADHLWAVRVGSPAQGRRVVMRTDAIAERLARPTVRPPALYLDPVVPHDGTKRLPLHPYALGALLGDGALGRRGIHFTSADQGVVNELQRCLPDGAIVKATPMAGRPYEYRIVDMGTHVNKNRVAAALSDLGLRVHSWEKFLPPDCFDISAHGRLALLQGLMDTDGCATKEGQATFSTTSRRLADDVLALVRSLGGRGTIECQPPARWTSPAQPIPQIGRPSYRMTVNLPHGQSPFRLARKAQRCKRRTLARGHRLARVEPTGIIAPVQCIRVSAPSRCYVTDDYMPTHNTRAMTTRVRYGEDGYGVWLAGALWDTTTWRDVATLRAASVSGDWRWRREIAAYLGDPKAWDLAGVQLVNSPGYPLYRVVASAAWPGDLELVATETVEEPMDPCPVHAPLVAGCSCSTTPVVAAPPGPPQAAPVDVPPDPALADLQAAVANLNERVTALEDAAMAAELAALDGALA